MIYSNHLLDSLIYATFDGESHYQQRLIKQKTDIMKNWTLYKPTQTEAEIILKLAQSKGIKVFFETRARINSGETCSANTYLLYDGEEIIGHDRKKGELLLFPEVIAEMHAFKSVPKVGLNDELEAEITSEGIQVGCQTISFDAFNELKKAVKKFKS